MIFLFKQVIFQVPSKIFQGVKWYFAIPACSRIFWFIEHEQLKLHQNIGWVWFNYRGVQSGGENAKPCSLVASGPDWRLA